MPTWGREQVFPPPMAGTGPSLASKPTSDLDEQTEQEIMATFQTIHARTGVTILLVTHTTQLVPYGTRSLAMAGGTIVNGRDLTRS